MSFERVCALADIPVEGALATEVDGEPFDPGKLV